MSQFKGKLITCNRCPESVFVKYIGTNETDGGYTVWDKFEELPEGWLYETEFGHLCPECAYIFKAFMTNFLSAEHLAQKWRLDSSI